MTIEIMKFILLYVLSLSIIVVFNYGAHYEERMENELEENQLDRLNKDKLKEVVDEHDYSGIVSQSTIC